jgi:hypothetical protein
MRPHLVPIAEVASSLVSKQLPILIVTLLLPLVVSCGTVTTPPLLSLLPRQPQKSLALQRQLWA